MKRNDRMVANLQSGDLTVFGLDLAALWEYLRLGWAQAFRWPVFRWLLPREPIRLVHADGTESIRDGVSAVRLPASGRPRFVAVALPEESLLRRSLSLPSLSAGEIRQACELDVRAASPFAESDLAWSYAISRSDDPLLRVDLALTSRSLIQSHLAACHGQTQGITPEVWIDGALPLVIPGYGESARLRRERRVRIMLLVLFAAALALGTMLAITPTLQLRLKAIEAKSRSDAIARTVEPQSKTRDELARLNEKVQLLASATRSRPDLVALLDQVTRLLPDDATLNRFEVTGGAVRLMGQAGNATALLQTLSAHSGFRDVRAPSGIARAQPGGKETFTIEFNLPAVTRP